jgi:hypothetical protein
LTISRHQPDVDYRVGRGGGVGGVGEGADFAGPEGGVESVVPLLVVAAAVAGFGGGEPIKGDGPGSVADLEPGLPRPAVDAAVGLRIQRPTAAVADGSDRGGL